MGLGRRLISLLIVIVAAWVAWAADKLPWLLAGVGIGLFLTWGLRAPDPQRYA